MNVIARSQNLTEERAQEKGAQRVGRDELFSNADFLSIHLRLSPRTQHLVGAAEFAQMKPASRLINTSRGPIVGEAALLQALTSGQIAGAAVNV